MSPGTALLLLVAGNLQQTVLAAHPCVHTLSLTVRLAGQDWEPRQAKAQIPGEEGDRFHLDGCASVGAGHACYAAYNGFAVHIAKNQHGRVVAFTECCAWQPGELRVSSDCKTQSLTGSSERGQLKVSTRKVLSKRPLAEGCSHVYLDLGSNIGVQVRKLFQPSLYPGAQMLPYFDSFFGEPSLRNQPSSSSGICAFGFEANPRFVGRLKRLEEAYHNLGWRVYFFAPYVLSDKANATSPFYAVCDHAADCNVESSIVDHRSVYTRGREKAQAVDIGTLDVAHFLEKEVLPARAKVAAKMDVEGSEFILLPHMLRNTQLCRGSIDILYLEWHEKLNTGAKNSSELLEDIVSTGHAACDHGPTTIISEGIGDEDYAYDRRALPRDFNWSSLN